jgi:AcrR family transcriptional regulator
MIYRGELLIMKERIYQSAILEISQRGLRFSIRDLASRLGISTKTVYSYFDSKEAIINYIVNRSIQEMKEKEETIMLDATLSLKQKLYLALVNVPQGVAFTSVHVLNDLQKLYPDQWIIVDEHLTHAWDSIQILMKEGMLKKELRDFDVALFIRVYVGAIYHLMDQQNPSLSLEEALSGTVGFLLSGIYKD